MKKLDYVDALRGIAILCVLIVHNQYDNDNLSVPIRSIIGQGARGVQLFYLTSAFTLFLSFKHRLPNENFPNRNFFIRRFFRIAPMYYLAIFYYLLQDGLGPRYWLGDQSHITILNIISNLLFLHGFYPYWITSLVPGGWSIAVEMTFYLLLPFLFSRIKNIRQAFNFFSLSLFLRTFLDIVLMKNPLIGYYRLWQEFLFLYFPSQLPVFSLGIILYFLISEKNSLKDIPIKSFLILFSGVLTVYFTVGIQSLFPIHIIFGLGFLLLAFLLSSYKIKLFVNPVITYIGKISFSMYLTHFGVLHWLSYFNLVEYWENGLLNYITRYLFLLILLILISSITYNLIEIPFQNLGKRIIQRWEK